MKRFSPGLAAPALLVVFVPFVGCIPDPDISKLPPYDGGGFAPDGAVIPIADASLDGTLGQDSGSDTGPADSAPPLGTVNGIVIDYTQGNGRGVVPGAVVSVSVPGNAAASVPASVTTDASGLFSIDGVPAGVTVQIGVSKPTDLVNGIAYSTTFLLTTVGAGQTSNVFPVLHEGCFQSFVLNPAPGSDAGNLPVALYNARCASPRSGAYAAMTFDQGAFEDPSSHIIWSTNNGTIRVEMIPLAYPANPANGNAPDLSWAVGLPGVATPPGLLGAAEYRVYGVQPGQPDILLGVHDTNTSVSIAIPIYTAPTGAPLAYSYAPASGAWASTSQGPSAAQDAGPALQYVTIAQVPQLSWWAATNGATAATCVTGTLLAGGSPLPNVLVRAAGLNYLGASTAQTNAAGLFCLDGVTSTAGGDGGVAQVALVAEALSGGVAYTGAKTFGLTTLTAGSCAASAADASASCTSLGPINLTPGLTCVSGTVGGAVVDGGALTTLNATLVNLDVLYAASAGIQSSAYVGQVTLGAGGAFCALAPPGTDLELVDPASGCSAPPPGAPIPVLLGSSAPACAAGGCADAGALTFGCPPLP